MLGRDIRYALRTLLANRGFAAAAALCLALGIGVNTAAFSILDGVLIQPLPYADPERLVVLNQSNPRAGVRFGALPYLDLQDWRQQRGLFAQVAPFQARALAITDDAEPERLLGGAIGWELFPMLGVQPILGRGFREDDDRAGAAPVILLSHSLWQRRYAGDRTIVGRAIRVDGKPHTVVGVMPPGFEFPAVHRAWVPVTPFVHDTPRSAHTVIAFARLAPDVSLERVRSDLTTIAGRLEAQYPENRGWSPLVRPMREYFIPEDIELVLVTMMGAVTLVLFVACANVANLLLARASARQREIALRAALGADRGQVIRQLLTESVILALVSAPLGVALAYYVSELIYTAIPRDQVPYFVGWSVNVRSMVYAITVAAVTGIVFGLVPALQASRADLHDGLKDGARGASSGAQRTRLRNALVIAEVGVSLVLLVGALLFVRSFMNLQRATGGIDTRPLMTMRFYMPEGDAYAPVEARTQRAADIVRHVEALAGVESAFVSNLIPLNGGGNAGPIAVDGQVFTTGEEPVISVIGVTSQLARTLDVPIRQGRALTETEALTLSRVALINESMATRFWPDGSALGRRFRLLGQNATADWMTVVGIVADFPHEPPLGRELRPSAYLPLAYDASLGTGITIRVDGDDAARVTNAVRHEIRQSDPTIAMAPAQSMEDLRQMGFWPYRIFGWTFSFVGVVSLLLAIVGVYGVLAYSIAQRTQEIGVRVALGASRTDVLRLVLGQGLRLTGAGIAVGLAGAFGVTRLIRSVLYNVTPTDPLTFGIIVVGLFGVAALASYVPARRAMKVDPIVALRVD